MSKYTSGPEYRRRRSLSPESWEIDSDDSHQSGASSNTELYVRRLMAMDWVRRGADGHLYYHPMGVPPPVDPAESPCSMMIKHSWSMFYHPDMYNEDFSREYNRVMQEFPKLYENAKARQDKMEQEEQRKAHTIVPTEVINLIFPR